MYFQALICHTDILIIDPSLEITDLLKIDEEARGTRTKKSIHQNKTIIIPGNTTNQTVNE